MQSLCSKIALVNQEPILFDMSIKDNILYGNPNASDQEMKVLQNHLLQMNLLQSYQKVITRLLEKMDIVFQRSKQRILPARAFLKDSNIAFR